MCGRLARDRDLDEARFGVVEISETRATPRFNIAPMQLDLIVRTEDDGRHLVASRWGLIPAWAKDHRIGAKTFNARVETLTERPAFRALVARHRCIVPASGFYEWPRTGHDKAPLYSPAPTMSRWRWLGCGRCGVTPPAARRAGDTTCRWLLGQPVEGYSSVTLAVAPAAVWDT